MVRLSPDEFLHAAMVGVTRQIDNLRNRRQDRYAGLPGEEAWRVHIEGACGELAVAKWLGAYWSGNLGNLRAADVAGLEVRTATRDDYQLIVHPGDRADARFVLVTGKAPLFVLRGWCYGREAQQDCYWSDPRGGRPAFFVPQERLHAMATLRHALEQAA